MVKKTITQVNISTTDGDVGILLNHVPSIFQLKPSMVSFIGGSEAVESYFVSGGFAVINADSTLDINATDYAFAARVYPIPGHAPAGSSAGSDDWDASDDVDNQMLEEAIRATIMQHNGPSDREPENAHVGAESY